MCVRLRLVDGLADGLVHRAIDVSRSSSYLPQSICEFWSMPENSGRRACPETAELVTRHSEAVGSTLRLCARNSAAEGCRPEGRVSSANALGVKRPHFAGELAAVVRAWRWAARDPAGRYLRGNVQLADGMRLLQVEPEHAAALLTAGSAEYSARIQPDHSPSRRMNCVAPVYRSGRPAPGIDVHRHSTEVACRSRRNVVGRPRWRSSAPSCSGNVHDLPARHLVRRFSSDRRYKR